MSFTLLNPQPPLRAETATTISDPGLYPDEVAVTLDAGDMIAVYVDRVWTPNNAGAEFYASARLINADGSTKLCTAGNEVVTETRQTCSQQQIVDYGIDVLSRCFLLAMLGETVPTVTVQSGNETVTIMPIQWSDIVLSNMSIRHAIAVVNAAGPATNVAALLMEALPT